MCGLAGFQGLGISEMDRAFLIMALGAGIDRRGGDAIGYAALADNKEIVVRRQTGDWCEARSIELIREATRMHTLAMHARFATCATKAAVHAHPFTISRGERDVLYGMHNGILYNAEDSAKKHGRKYSVDSRELFELLADGHLDEIEKLEGYGTAVWMEASEPGVVYMVRMTDDADLEIAKVKGGGVVWGSTERIVRDGLGAVGAEVDSFLVIEPHIIHSVSDGRAWKHSNMKLSVSGARAVRSLGTSSGYGEFSRAGWMQRWQEDDFLAEEDTKSDDAKGEEEEVEMEVCVLESDETDLEVKKDICAMYGIDLSDVEHMSAADLEELVEKQWEAW